MASSRAQRKIGVFSHGGLKNLGDEALFAAVIQNVRLRVPDAQIVGFTGGLHFNTAMPDGTPQKLLDVSCLASLGWRAKIQLAEGIKSTYAWFCDNVARCAVA